MQAEHVNIVMWPKAEAMGPMVQPFLERSYQRFVENKRESVVSGYMGYSLIVVTAENAGQCYQLVFTKEEIPSLPSEMRAMLKRDLAREPAVRGYFSTADTEWRLSNLKEESRKP